MPWTNKPIGNALQASGYRMIVIGKWHLGLEERHHPQQRGLDDFYGFLGGSRSYWSLGNPSSAQAMRHGHEPVDEAKTITYLIVFVNDNGGAASNASENLPLRGFKGRRHPRSCDHEMAERAFAGHQSTTNRYPR